MCMAVTVCVRERVCENVCVCARERERQRARENVCVCVCMCECLSGGDRRVSLGGGSTISSPPGAGVLLCSRTLPPLSLSVSQSSPPSLSLLLRLSVFS